MSGMIRTSSQQPEAICILPKNVCLARFGSLAERLQVACQFESHPLTPASLAIEEISGEQREMAAFVARFGRPTEPERDE